jgi:hypothetical protein
VATKKKVAAKPASKVAKTSDVPHDFPRMLYHADGTEMIFTSAAEFAKADDGKWATNPGVHGRETAPGKKE